MDFLKESHRHFEFYSKHGPIRELEKGTSGAGRHWPKPPFFLVVGLVTGSVLVPLRLWKKLSSQDCHQYKTCNIVLQRVVEFRQRSSSRTTFKLPQPLSCFWTPYFYFRSYQLNVRINKQDPVNADIVAVEDLAVLLFSCGESDISF